MVLKKKKWKWKDKVYRINERNDTEIETSCLPKSLARDRKKSTRSTFVSVWVKGYVINRNKEVRRKSYKQIELGYGATEVFLRIKISFIELKF